MTTLISLSNSRGIIKYYSKLPTVISALFLCNCGKLLATHSFISSRHLVRVVGQVFVG